MAETTHGMAIKSDIFAVHSYRRDVLVEIINMSVYMKKVLVLMLACLGSWELMATNYYAAPNATGSGMSYEQPAELVAAIDKMASGDTLFLLGGQYDYSTRINVGSSKSGTEARKTVIMAYPGEKPILDFRQMTYGERGVSIASGTTYMHVKGLTIRYAGKNGLINYGSYCVFENLDVYGCGDSGIQMKNGGNNVIRNCDSHDNFDYQLGGVNAADYGGNADGFADKQHSGDANEYYGCRAWNNSDDGWDFFQRVTNGSTTIMENCVCFANGPEFYDMTNHPRYEKDKAWFDQFQETITVTDADGAKIAVSLSKYTNWGNGNGFKLGGGSTVHHVALHRCLSVQNTVRGFDQNNDFGDMTLYNCTGYDNGCDYGFGNRNGGNLVIKNCVSLKSRSNNYFQCQQVTNENNTWNTKGVSATEEDFISTDVALVLADRDAEGNLPVTAFMQLDEGSDLIDAGVEVDIPYGGKAPDMGCFEFGELTVYPCGLTCTTANRNQSVLVGDVLDQVVFTWKGGAETASVMGLPDGVEAVIDYEAKTLTLQGAPTENGKFEYVVTATGGENDPVSIQGIIIVKSADAKRVAYVTMPDSPADKLILERLNDDLDFAVSIENANTNNDYTSYDLVVLSPVPSSAAAGLKNLKDVQKPLLVLKPFMMKNTVWNWGNPANTADAAMKVLEANHPIFKNLTIEDNLLTLFNQVSTNGVTMLSAWTVPPTPSHKLLATPMSNPQAESIVECEPGTDINGTVLKEKFLMIGISEYSTANLTEGGVQLVENACRYLLGLEIKTSLGQTTNDVYHLAQYGSTLSVLAEDGVESLSIYSLTGRMLTTIPNHSTLMLPQGVYVVMIRNDKGQIHYQKLLWE